ncbi:hypothetical protein Hanom_Chr03g00227611 [Helianthus anomalus]
MTSYVSVSFPLPLSVVHARQSPLTRLKWSQQVVVALVLGFKEDGGDSTSDDGRV